ncbi:nitrate and chloride transporter [Panicum miliaceum]|uniref:Nitrate and chloride transporter n=1 Tax=Panicum miliaceum TaxID=4540 RepID=A0A3L6TBR0_PANMI|nr:nitrate and chloride transporter [Panicum miliaceum]
MVFDAAGAGSWPAASAAAPGNPLRVILTRGFARQVLAGRWFTVFASLLIMAASGATYIFGAYSGALKSSLGYDQRALNTVSFAKDLGANLGVLSGLLNEVTPPWVVLAAGAAMNLAGYLMVYLAVSGRTPRPPLGLLCLYVFAGANSQSFANTGALVTCVKNFPESRGVVIGILKGFVGLSGAVYTQLYLAFYGGEDPESLILLIAWLPAAVSVVFVHTVRYLPYPRRRGGQETSTDPFFCFLYLSIALACFLLVMIVVQGRVHFSRDAYGVAATPLLILLLMPLCVVIKQEYKIYRERQLDDALRAAGPPPTITVVDAAASNGVQMSTDAKKTEQQQPVAPPASRSNPTPSPSSCLGRFGGCVRTMFRPPARGEDHTILQALVSVDMLVLFVATICGVGGTLTAIDNMGQIGQSLGYPSRSTNTFVSLISIWNYAGRVTAGYASEAVLSRHRVPRPLLLTLVLLLACAGHLLIAFGVPRSLYAASVVIGFCFGAQWPLVFAVISEVFGLKYYSTLYNFGGMASPVGSYLLNVRVAGRLYDAEAARQRGGGVGGGGGGGGHEVVCLGVECFRRSFLIITAATALGAAVSLALVWRTWGFYRGDIYARFREEEGEGKDGGRLPAGQPRRAGAEGEAAAPQLSTAGKGERDASSDV